MPTVPKGGIIQIWSHLHLHHCLPALTPCPFGEEAGLSGDLQEVRKKGKEAFMVQDGTSHIMGMWPERDLQGVYGMAWGRAAGERELV